MVLGVWQSGLGLEILPGTKRQAVESDLGPFEVVERKGEIG